MPTLLRCFKDGRAGDNIQVTADPNGTGQKQVTRQETWTAVFDSVADQITAVNVASGGGLPIAGNVYDGLFCSRVYPQRDRNNPCVWRVQVDYQNQVPQGAGSGSSIWNLNIRKGSAAREETATRDRLNLPLVNTSGNQLPKLPNNTLYDEQWAITWSTAVAPDWGDIDGKTNSDTVTFTICGITRTYQKSQVKVTGSSFSSTKIITATDGSTRQVSFIYQCELQIQCRKPKWVWSAPNEGFCGKVGLAFDQEFTDATGQPYSAPTKMALDGTKAPKGSVVLKLPDDAIGKDTPNAGRKYEADGAFELEMQTALMPLISTLRDNDNN